MYIKYNKKNYYHTQTLFGLPDLHLCIKNMQEYMSFTGMDDKLILSGNPGFDSFTGGFLPGNFICIVNQPKSINHSVIQKLFRKYAEKYKSGFIVSDIMDVKDKLIYVNNNMSYSEPTHFLEEVELNVRRWLIHYGKIIVFINDLNALYLERFNANEPRSAEFTMICYGLKRLAMRNKIVIIACLIHELKSDRSLDRFNLQGLHFLGNGIYAFDHLYSIKLQNDHVVEGIQKKDFYSIENLLSVKKKPALIQL
jgi:hypothetical protein